jgi:hypothetical protein
MHHHTQLLIAILNGLLKRKRKLEKPAVHQEELVETEVSSKVCSSSL